jgi:hypothetical protein
VSGFEFADHVGRARPGIPVLLMSGSFFRENSEIREYMQPGSASLARPFAQGVRLRTRARDRPRSNLLSPDLLDCLFEIGQQIPPVFNTN